MISPRHHITRGGLLKTIFPFYNPTERRVVPSGNSYVPLLDTLSVMPDVAVSMYKLNSAAINCVRIRRDSDNAETDIGFTADGLIDTAAITAHLAGANGYVKTFYDQSGNGRDMTEAVTTEQFLYAETGGVDNKPCFISTITGATIYPMAASIATYTDMSLIVAFKTSGTISAGGIGYFTTASNRSWFAVLGAPVSSAIRPNASLSSTLVIAINTEYACYTTHADGTPLTVFNVNSAQQTAATAITRATVDALADNVRAHNFNLGIIWPSVLSGADAAALQAWYNLNFNKTTTGW